MDDLLGPKQIHKLMAEAADKVGYLSGESCKVLIALAMRPESRESMFALKQATCIEDNAVLVQAVSDLESMNLAKFDGKGGILIDESIIA